MRIGFLGTGRIAEAMVDALAGGAHALTVSRRSEAVSARIRERHPAVRLVDDNQTLVAENDVIFVCLLARTAWEVLPTLSFQADQRVISVMADAPVARLREAVAPAAEVCSTIPMPFIATAPCPLPVCPGASAPLLEAIFGERGLVIPVADEAAMTPHWAVAGTAAGVFDTLDTIARWLAAQTGDGVGAERYVAGLLGGYLGSLPKDGSGRFEEAIDHLSTPGGLNHQFMTHLRDRYVPETVREGLDTLRERLG